MLNKLKKIFHKKFNETKEQTEKTVKIIEVFQLKFEEITIGELKFENGEWIFEYSNEFKNHKNEYNHIAGFSNLDRIYKSDELWPFFQSRIPGLKQPSVKEIIKKEHIDSSNKVELLKRFGKESINNPFELELV